MENLIMTQDFTSLQNENEKPVSELFPGQLVRPQFVYQGRGNRPPHPPAEGGPSHV